MNDKCEEEFGQQEAHSVLTRIFQSKRIPHAFLFVGKEGVGKHNTAVQFAKLLNSNLPEEKKTSLFKKIDQLEEPYIKYVLPLPRGKSETSDDSPYDKLSADLLDTIKNEIKTKAQNPFYGIQIEGANNIKINSIRELRKFLNINYDDLSYRVIIIHEAHLMNDEAQNALLKSLEEPPEGIIFILLTSTVEKLLPTIISRCWRINFKPLQRTIVQSILSERFGVHPENARKVSYFADGSVTEAFKLCERDFEEIVENAINILRFSIAGRYNTAFRKINDFLDNTPKESMKTLINLILIWLNDTVKNRNELGDYYFEQYSDTLEKFNQKFSSSDVMQVYHNLEKQIDAIGKNVSLNIIGMNVIFEIASIAVR